MFNYKYVKHQTNNMLVGYQNQAKIIINDDFSYSIVFCDGGKQRKMKFILNNLQIEFLEKIMSYVNLRWNNFHQSYVLSFQVRKAIHTIEKKKREIAQPLYRNKPSIICRPCKHINEEGRDICNRINCKFTHKGQPCHHNCLVADGDNCRNVERNDLKKIGLYEELPVLKPIIKPVDRPVSQICHPCSHENVAENKYCSKIDCKFTHIDQDCHHGYKVANGYECKTLKMRTLKKTNPVTVTRSNAKQMINPKTRQIPQTCYPCKHKEMCQNHNCKFVHPKQRCKHKKAVCDGQPCDKVF